MSVERSLRERKKERTRKTIRVEAFRLFREQGYAETTVEQIAAAAEVSPSTFFRYFPSKEQLVLTDDLDPAMDAALRAQPRGQHPIAAFRNAMSAVFAEMDPEEFAFERQRQGLLFGVPELRSAIGQEYHRSIGFAAELMADYLGRSPEDFEVRVTAGAMIGGVLAVMTTTPMNTETLTDALAFLEKGLPFDAPVRAERQ
ncbi:TetR family transcriptional regulator [Nocardia sp. NPDC058658]|uniref:acyl-CoA-like ligand-binding transcription factor n=1 Tax=Nocardia sp. NPDC058658 TaxID=3346580 RepID=UPI003666BCE7